MNALLTLARMVNFTSPTDVLSGVNIEHSLKMEENGEKRSIYSRPRLNSWSFCICKLCKRVIKWQRDWRLHARMGKTSDETS